MNNFNLNKKEMSTTKIINAIYNKVGKLSKSMKNRIRARNIFAGLDKKSGNDFARIINIARERANHVKAGNLLSNELVRSASQYESLLQRINEQEMYNNSSELLIDQQELKEHKAKKSNAEINEMFRTLKKTFYPDTISKYIKPSASSAGITPTVKERNVLSKNELSPLTNTTQFNNNNSNSNKNDIFSNINNSTMYMMQSNRESVINEYFEKERTQLVDKVSKYLTKSNELKLKQKEQNEKADKIDKSSDNINNNNNTNHYGDHLSIEGNEAYKVVYNEKRKLKEKEIENSKQAINYLHHLRLLHYTKPSMQTFKQRRFLERKEFNIPKLMRYTRTTAFLENNKNISFKPTTHNNNNTNTFLTGTNIKQLGDTVNLVKKELKAQTTSLNHSFDNKEQRIERLIRSNSLPAINEYTTLIHNIMHKPNLSQTTSTLHYNNNNNNNTNTVNQGITNNNNNNVIISNHNNNLWDSNSSFGGVTSPFYKSMNDIYQRKRKQWLVEDAEREKNSTQLKKTDDKCAEFIKEIHKVKRGVSKFSDPYSIREGKTNQCLNDICVLFGNKLLTKYEKQEQIENYFQFYLEKEEKEKIEDEQQYINQSKLNKEMKKAEKKQQIIEKGKTYPEFHEKTIFENVNLNDMYDKDSTYAQTIFKQKTKYFSASMKEFGKHNSNNNNEENDRYQECLNNKERYMNKTKDKMSKTLL